MSNIKDNQSSSNVDTKISGDDSNQTNANNVDQTNETSFLKGISQTVEGAVNTIKDKLGLSNETTEADKNKNVENVDQNIEVVTNEQNTGASFNKNLGYTSDAASATIGAASSTLNIVNNAGINYIGEPIYNAVVTTGNVVKNAAAATGNAAYNTAAAVGNGVKKVVNAPFTLISSVIWKSEKQVKQEDIKK